MPCFSAQNPGLLAQSRDFLARNRCALLASTVAYRFLLLSTALHFGPHNMPLSPLVNTKLHFFQK